MEHVAFIDCDGEPDLCVSFAIPTRQDSFEVECLILSRSPGYEEFVGPEEHGVRVSFDRDILDGKGLLQVFKYSAEEKTVFIQAEWAKYELDVSDAEREDLKEMVRVLRKMNFDQKFKLEGV
jgi:hypothetical protein